MQEGGKHSSPAAQLLPLPRGRERAAGLRHSLPSLESHTPLSAGLGVKLPLLLHTAAAAAAAAAVWMSLKTVLPLHGPVSSAFPQQTKKTTMQQQDISSLYQRARVSKCGGCAAAAPPSPACVDA